MMQYRFIEPLDVLNFRGNKSFGEGGEHGESRMPPMPSIFAGAIRSNWLAQAQVDMGAFANNRATLPAALQAQMGSPDQPGSFRIQGLWLAQKNTGDSISPCMPLPADVLKLKSGVHYLKPQVLPAGLSSSAITQQHAVLRAKAEKPEGGQWLNSAGMQAWLQGEPIDASKHLLVSAELWSTDHRLGIALDAMHRTAEDGRLYTTEAIAMQAGTGFLVVIQNAAALPASGQLRLGGDGRAAAMSTVVFTVPEPDWVHIEKHKRFRLVLTTPGLFPDGWQLPGSQGESIRIGRYSAKIASAAVSRHDVISGWDLAKWQPKAAERITPAGSVYWLENYSGDIASLQELVHNGIGMDTLDPTRRAEGFNNIMIANWI